MELLQLRYFKELAEREHLTHTAQHLMVSAPTLSATISRLEKDLGVSLFDRVGRSIRLNDNGRILLRYANAVFDALQNAQTELSDASDKSQSRISLGITAQSLWTDGIQAFLSRHPEAAVSHTGIKLDKIDDISFCSQFDFIITATRDLPTTDLWEHEVLIHDDQPVLVLSPGHRFSKRKTIDLIEARDEHFVALSRGYSSRRFFDEACAAAGFVPKVVIECDYLLRSELIAAGYGLSFSSVLGINASIMGNFDYVKVESPVIHRTQAILWNKNRKLAKTAVAFREFMVDYYRQHDKAHSRWLTP